MPGILPMKVIKVTGTTAQTRIAQACDRCRSKKIKCDGLAPTCTQCTVVGFECKTSDKLSRRAFPRGYTESLEDRVRSLETEVKELKDLLDEKDEKIDIISKMHSQTPCSPRRPSLPESVEIAGRRASVRTDKDDVFKLQQSPFLLGGQESDAYFMGNSSGGAFIDAFKSKLQQSGKVCADLNSSVFSMNTSENILSSGVNADKVLSTPPRLFSDQMVNIYFQEWAPLFPVLHKPTFLSVYQHYVADPRTVTDKRSLAQLNLVFSIAAISKESQIPQSAVSCERQWSSAMESFTMENSLVNLQCLILAQIYYLQKGSPTKLLHYKALAIGIAQRLGLHLSQKRFALGALTVETRKKVFWTLYTLDCFSAAFLGLPKLLKEEDIHCEYPVDADDEYVTEQGFQATLPGEYTKISSALALFRGARVLSKVLDQNYPAASSTELSLRSISALDEELENWSSSLAPHLKMTFVQDKPSTQVVSSRCPLLSLTYHYIRTLIHRPAVCANLGDRASSSVIALASSSKHVIQLIQLLDERNLSFSHCINKSELLVLSGFGVLFQALDLDKDSKLVKDNSRTICSVTEMLDRRNAPGTAEFQRVSCSMLSVPRKPSCSGEPSLSRKGSIIMPKEEEFSQKEAQVQNRAQEQLQLLAARYTLATTGNHLAYPAPKEKRRTSSSATSSSNDLGPRTDTSGYRPIAPSHRRAPSSSPRSSLPMNKPAIPLYPQSYPTPTRVYGSIPTTNLDYLGFTPDTTQPLPYETELNPDNSVWDTLLHSLDDSHLGNPTSLSYPYFLNSKPIPSLHTMYPPGPQTGSNTSDGTWSPEMWDFGLGDLGGAGQAASQSGLSFSDESLTSGEDFASVDMGKGGGGESAFGAMMMPHYAYDED